MGMEAVLRHTLAILRDDESLGMISDEDIVVGDRKHRGDLQQWLVLIKPRFSGPPANSLTFARGEKPGEETRRHRIHIELVDQIPDQAVRLLGDPDRGIPSCCEIADRIRAVITRRYKFSDDIINLEFDPIEYNEDFPPPKVWLNFVVHERADEDQVGEREPEVWRPGTILSEEDDLVMR